MSAASTGGETSRASLLSVLLMVAVVFLASGGAAALGFMLLDEVLVLPYLAVSLYQSTKLGLVLWEEVLKR